MKHGMIVGFLAGALLAGCIDTEAEGLETTDDEETSSVEQGSWSSWYDLSGPYGSGVVRACKTATRINWEFGYNSYARAATWGDGIGRIESDISGVSWGSKYRTRAGTTFSIALGTNGNWKGIQYPISWLPNC